MTASKRLELRGLIVALYGGFDSADIEIALEDGSINAEEYSELAGLKREENYRNHIAGANERCRQRALAAFDARKKAMEMTVPAGMVLRGSKWVPLLNASA